MTRISRLLTAFFLLASGSLRATGPCERLLVGDAVPGDFVVVKIKEPGGRKRTRAGVFKEFQQEGHVLAFEDGGSVPRKFVDGAISAFRTGDLVLFKVSDARTIPEAVAGVVTGMKYGDTVLELVADEVPFVSVRVDNIVDRVQVIPVGRAVAIKVRLPNGAPRTISGVVRGTRYGGTVLEFADGSSAPTRFIEEVIEAPNP